MTSFTSLGAREAERERETKEGTTDETDQKNPGTRDFAGYHIDDRCFYLCRYFLRHPLNINATRSIRHTLYDVML